MSIAGPGLNTIPIDGRDGAPWLYPAAFDESVASGGAAAPAFYPVLYVVGIYADGSGVSDIFYVGAEPDMFLVASDDATFIVPPGKLPNP